MGLLRAGRGDGLDVEGVDFAEHDVLPRVLRGRVEARQLVRRLRHLHEVERPRVAALPRPVRAAVLTGDSAGVAGSLVPRSFVLNIECSFFYPYSRKFTIFMRNF